MSVDGILPVIPTPLRDGAFDPRSFERLLEHMLPSVDGYTLLGSTGEAPSMTRDQRMAIAADALAMTPDDARVVVGVSHTSADESIAIARHAREHGAAGVLCAAPYYFANTPDGMLRHLERLDDALEIDLVLYDNPDATKTRLRPEWIVRWAGELEHLSSVKLTDHDLGKVAELHAAGLTVLAGDDPILLHYLTAGVDGAMVIAPAVLPGSFRAVWERTRAGDHDGALEIFAGELAGFIHAFGIGEEIATTKALLAEIGVFDSDEVLTPLSGVGPERRHQLGRVYEIARAAERARVDAVAA